jgi:hypothetical protein
MNTDLFVKGTAAFSPDRRYRTLLTRTWNERLPRLAGIFLNPSTADADIDDMTMTIFAERARRMGCGGTIVGNLFTFRATHPPDMMAAENPIGIDGDTAIIQIAEMQPKMLIAGWGDGGLYLHRAAHVAKMLDDAGVTVYCLGMTKAGQPRHPLRIPYSFQPVVWRMAA